MIKSPMLAGVSPDLGSLKYPVYVTSKIDGVRTLTTESGPVSRTFKSVPNKHMHALLSQLPTGLDGEIIVPGLDFNGVSGAWRNADGCPDFLYRVFDYVGEGAARRYTDRITDLIDLRMEARFPFVSLLCPIRCDSPEEVTELEERALADGLEGLMIRSGDGPYKFGRSTAKEGYLLKLKRFTDTEATVVGTEELMHNGNTSTVDCFGHAKRSSHLENKIGTGTLGSLVCSWGDTTFNIGTGFTAAKRAELWATREALVGATVNFKYQAGVGSVPRFPVFRGFRHD